MVSSPIAGTLTENYGNRPFMVAGLLLQAVGLGWVASVATAHLGYTELGLALGVAGIGIGMVFPTVATEIVASVPADEIGVANGTNSALRELGGVFGVSVLAAVFSRPGVYLSPGTFVTGFRAAVWVGAGFSFVGAILSAATIPRLQPLQDAAGHVEPSWADAGK